MIESFGLLPGGQAAHLYSISCGAVSAKISDFGATLVNLYVPDGAGQIDDVVLAWRDCNDCIANRGFLGATVGRNANRIAGASFVLNGQRIQLPKNNGENNLHSGPDSYGYRIWQVTDHKPDSITFSLHSPDGDQGFPGNADISVTYRLEGTTLRIIYDAISDKDTVFNLTNHSYFNLAGHHRPELAGDMQLMLPSPYFTVLDREGIPTGQMEAVEGTPMDFRIPKPIGRDVNDAYPLLALRNGFDHNYQVCDNLAAVLTDPSSGRTMEITTDLPGIQIFYPSVPNGQVGKDGVRYIKGSGIALETQFYPDSVNHPQWPQPFVKAGQRFQSETSYKFSW